MSGPIDPPEPTPRRRVAEPLPPYRYVPGWNPHPFRHVGGHMYTDGSAPAEAPWDPDGAWQRDERWLYGLDLLDQRYWWEAHEALEALWHHAPPGAVRDLLQGLIQTAAHRLKRHMGHTRAAGTLADRARARLTTVRSVYGGAWRGVDLDALLEELG
ncbi:MAG: DUF309 domain-containing protein [Proteobacteria bacterium]|nr:DUF309 domain-containing protein [Pseudomonadota bacterium]MCP4915896.1 DUF309 domain-containing protein [Pseudomonadota bacterium]